MIKAKLKCIGLTKTWYGSEVAELSADIVGEPTDAVNTFATAIPNCEVKIEVDQPSAIGSFVAGRDYLVEFSEVQPGPGPTLGPQLPPEGLVSTLPLPPVRVWSDSQGSYHETYGGKLVYEDASGRFIINDSPASEGGQRRNYLTTGALLSIGKSYL